MVTLDKHAVENYCLITVADLRKFEQRLNYFENTAKWCYQNILPFIWRSYSSIRWCHTVGRQYVCSIYSIKAYYAVADPEIGGKGIIPSASSPFSLPCLSFPVLPCRKRPIKCRQRFLVSAVIFPAGPGRARSTNAFYVFWVKKIALKLLYWDPYNK